MKPVSAISGASERGSISSWMISGAFILILGVGIAVDLTGQVHAQTRANDLANEAARAGAQQLNEDTAITGGGGASLDTAAAREAASAYLASAGLGAPTLRVSDDVVEVTVETQYETKFLSIIGLTTMRAQGTGEARAVQAIDGVGVAP